MCCWINVATAALLLKCDSFTLVLPRKHIFKTITFHSLGLSSILAQNFSYLQYPTVALLVFMHTILVYRCNICCKVDTIARGKFLLLGSSETYCQYHKIELLLVHKKKCDTI